MPAIAAGVLEVRPAGRRIRTTSYFGLKFSQDRDDFDVEPFDLRALEDRQAVALHARATSLTRMWRAGSNSAAAVSDLPPGEHQPASRRRAIASSGTSMSPRGRARGIDPRGSAQGCESRTQDSAGHQPRSEVRPICPRRVWVARLPHNPAARHERVICPRSDLRIVSGMSWSRRFARVRAMQFVGRRGQLDGAAAEFQFR